MYIQAYTTSIPIYKALQTYRKHSKHFKNTENIPLVDEGDVRGRRQNPRNTNGPK